MQRTSILNASSLSDCYRAYIDCLNRQDWARLGDHVVDDVEHNGRPLGLGGYREMLQRDFESIPDLRFTIGLLICEPLHVAARLDFRCTPKGVFLGLPVDGRLVSFTENVIYAYRGSRISLVWSIVDKGAIEAQLAS